MKKFLYFLLCFFAHSHLSFAQTCNLLNESLESPVTATSTIIFPTGWQNNSSYIANDPALARTGNQYGGMNAAGDYIILKAFDCPGDFRFYWRSSSINGVFTVNIDWSEDLGANWTTAHTITAVGGGASPTTYQLASVNFPENTLFSTGNDILIRIHMSSRTSNSFYFDDLCVSQGVCRMNLSFQYNSPCIQANQNSSFTVCSQDINGIVETGFTGNISLSKLTGGGIVSGTLTKAAVSGCATFNDIQFSTAENYSLRATEPSPRTVDSKVFNVKTTCDLSSMDIKMMSYNLLNFPDGSTICGSSTVIPNREDTLKKIIDYVLPDVLAVVELQTLAGSNLILNEALNIGGRTQYAAANFVENTSTSVKTYNNMFYYNTDKMTLFSQQIVPTSTRDISLYTVKLIDPNEATNGATYIDFYVSHLKAGGTAADITDRANDCQLLANFIAGRAARNAFFSGDFNFYTSTEAGYRVLLDNPTNPFYDPINSVGNWDGNFYFRDIHTQTTRAVGINMDCGAQGGMDSRFDFILATNEVLTGSQRVSYQTNSYNELGNNGSTFNLSINDSQNTSSVPKSVQNALFYMSDHVPVVLSMTAQLPIPAALPIELESFTAKYTPTKNWAVIHWEYSKNQEIQHFVLEKSADGEKFSPIAWIEYDAAQKMYSYTDTDLMNGTFYYRLKIIKQDNTTAYSQKIAIRVEQERVTLYPNPAKNELYLSYQVLKPTEASIFVYNILGVKLYEGKVYLDSENGKLSIEYVLHHLDSGTYIIELSTPTISHKNIFIRQQQGTLTILNEGIETKPIHI